jgi:hypothetical protein
MMFVRSQWKKGRNDTIGLDYFMFGATGIVVVVIDMGQGRRNIALKGTCPHVHHC